MRIAFLLSAVQPVRHPAITPLAALLICPALPAHLQMEVLQAMDAGGQWQTAAQLLRRLPTNMRKDLLNRVEPDVSARVLQVRPPC